MRKMAKEGYQPTENTTKIIPPNTSSCVHMKKDGYTWEDLDKAWWEGFDNAKNKMEKRIEELEEYNKYLKRKRQGGIQKQYNKVAIIKQLNDQLAKAKELLKDITSSYGSTEVSEAQLYLKIKKAEQFISEVEK